MKTQAVFAVPLVLVLTASLGGYIGMKGNKARQSPSAAVCDAPTFDFGTIPDDAPVEHWFRLQNLTGRSATIREVMTSCGCTTPILPSHPIGPRGFGTVGIHFNPARMHGLVMKRVTIWFTDADKPTLLSITADVRPILQSSTDSIVRRSSGRQATGWQPLRLTNTSNLPIRLTRITSSLPDLRPRPTDSQTIPARGSALVSFEPGIPRLGSYTGSLHLEARTPRPYSTDIFASETTKCRWHLSDSELYIGFLQKKQSASGSVTVSDLPVTQVKKVWTDAGVSGHVSVKPAANGTGTTVSLALDGTGVPLGEISSSVYLEPEPSLGPIIRIPIVGAIEQPNDCHCHH